VQKKHGKRVEKEGMHFSIIFADYKYVIHLFTREKAIFTHQHFIKAATVR